MGFPNILYIGARKYKNVPPLDTSELSSSKSLPAPPLPIKKPMTPRRKKVLYLITKANWGGAQRYVFDLASNLPKQKFEPVVAAGEGNALFQALKEAGIRTIRIPGLKKNIGVLNELIALFHLTRLVISERPDIVHFNSSKIGVIGAVANRLAGCFMHMRPHAVFTVHGWVFAEDRARAVQSLMKNVSAAATRFHDSVITLSSRDHALAKAFVPKQKLVLIPNGIDPIRYDERIHAREFLSRHLQRDITPNTLVIGTIAELTPNKGLNYLVRAAHLMARRVDKNRSIVVIIGDGKERASLERLTRNRGLSDVVHFAGFIPEASRFLKGLDIFVAPSVKEGLPYAIMEAMAAGLPIVASDVGGIPDLITSDLHGVVIRPKSPAHIAASLHSLLHDPARRMILGENAQERITSAFPLRRMIAKTARLYTKRTT